MSRRGDLIALRDAVQAGEWLPGLAQRSIGGVQTYHNARKAFEGSVDAALAFSAAALPGKDVKLYSDYGKWVAKVNWFHMEWQPTFTAPGPFGFSATAETPARALLLATLNALIADADR